MYVVRRRLHALAPYRSGGRWQVGLARLGQKLADRRLGLLVLTLALGLYAFSIIGPKPLVGAPLLVLSVILVGCWQHWLAIISHESTHYRLFESRAANDWAGRIAGMLIGVSTFAYRITLNGESMRKNRRAEIQA